MQNKDIDVIEKHVMEYATGQDAIRKRARLLTDTELSEAVEKSLAMLKERLPNSDAAMIGKIMRMAKENRQLQESLFATDNILNNAFDRIIVSPSDGMIIKLRMMEKDVKEYTSHIHQIVMIKNVAEKDISYLKKTLDTQQKLASGVIIFLSIVIVLLILCAVLK